MQASRGRSEQIRQAAKEVAIRGTCTRDKFNSLSQMTRLITELTWKESHKWVKKEHRNRKSNNRGTYLLQNKRRVPTVGTQRPYSFVEMKSEVRLRSSQVNKNLIAEVGIVEK